MKTLLALLLLSACAPKHDYVKQWHADALEECAKQTTGTAKILHLSPSPSAVTALQMMNNECIAKYDSHMPSYYALIR